jgi:hypothetical protein
MKAPVPPAEEKAVMLMLYAPGSTGMFGEPVLGKTRLMKEVFLLDYEAKSSDPILHVGPFLPYKYGPFNRKVAAATDDLTNAHLVTISGEGQWVRISLTEQGRSEAQTLWQELPLEAKKDLLSIKARYNSQPLATLLHYVYSRYPEYAVASEIRENLVGGA